MIDTLKSVERLLQSLYESPSLTGDAALPLIDAELAQLREAIAQLDAAPRGSLTSNQVPR